MVWFLFPFLLLLSILRIPPLHLIYFEILQEGFTPNTCLGSLKIRGRPLMIWGRQSRKKMDKKMDQPEKRRQTKRCMGGRTIPNLFCPCFTVDKSQIFVCSKYDPSLGQQKSPKSLGARFCSMCSSQCNLAKVWGILDISLGLMNKYHCSSSYNSILLPVASNIF